MLTQVGRCCSVTEVLQPGLAFTLTFKSLFIKIEDAAESDIEFKQLIDSLTGFLDLTFVAENPKV